MDSIRHTDNYFKRKLRELIELRKRKNYFLWHTLKNVWVEKVVCEMKM